jgi:hypothetical protein
MPALLRLATESTIALSRVSSKPCEVVLAVGFSGRFKEEYSLNFCKLGGAHYLSEEKL